MDILLSSIVAGLLLGMVLAIVALGLTIIFGVMDIVNFAHGEFLMIGMYTGLLTAQATGIDPLLTLGLRALGGDATPFIPDRLTDGYGVHPDRVPEHAERADLFVTVDCGVSNVTEVAALRSAGHSSPRES